MKRLLLLSIFSIFYLTISAQTKTWIGSAGGEFGIATNWNPEGIPTNINDVIIPTGSNILMESGSRSLKSIKIQGNAVFTMQAHLTVAEASSIASNATLIWNSGNFYGPGSITNNGTINFMESGTKAIGGTLNLINNGVININSDADFILGFGSPLLTNSSSGIININSDGKLTYTQGYGTLINAGTINKLQNDGLYTVLANFTNNNGTISIDTGIFKLNNSNASFIDGVYNVTAGSTMQWESTIQILGTLTGEINGQINWLANLNVVPETQAVFDFTGPSEINWMGGSLIGNGTLKNNYKIKLTTSASKNIRGTTVLNNEGTVVIDSNGDLILGYGSGTFNNAATGTLKLNSTGNISYTQGYGTLINYGNIKKLQDNGTIQVLSKFINNNGTISVENGTLKLNNGFSILNDGTYNVSEGNTFEWANVVNVYGTLTGQIDGQINWTANLVVADTTEAIFNFSGGSHVNWSGGSLTGEGTLTNQSNINLISTATKNIRGTTILNNEGTVAINSEGALILGYGSGTFNNAATGILKLNSNGLISYTQGYGTLINYGTIKKLQNSDVVQITSKFTNNNGTISVEKGTLKLNNGYTILNDGIYNVTEGSTLEWANTVYPTGTLTGLVTGQISWTGFLEVPETIETTFNFTGGSNVIWSNGTLAGNGTLINESKIILTSENSKFINGTTTLENTGIIDINSEGDFVLGRGTPLLNNTQTGIINLITDGTITYTQGVGTVINSGIINKLSTGTFTIKNGITNTNPGKIICEDGLLISQNYLGDGIMAGNGSVQLPPSTIFEGTISPGLSPGTLTFTNGYKSSVDTILDIELDDAVAGTGYDVFAVVGDAALEGTIEVALNYSANLNDEFVILTANSVTSCNLPATVSAHYDSHDYTFDVICNTDNITLKVTSIVLGTNENSLSNLKMYPNPTNGNFTIDLGKEYSEVSLEIYNMLGQMISSEKFASTKIITKEITSAAGVYFVKVSTAKEGSNTLRIIKQ